MSVQRVLIVDGDTPIAILAAAILGAAPRRAIDIAHCGRDALSWINRAIPSLVLVDEHLPGHRRRRRLSASPRRGGDAPRADPCVHSGR